MICSHLPFSSELETRRGAIEHVTLQTEQGDAEECRLAAANLV